MHSFIKEMTYFILLYVRFNYFIEMKMKCFVYYYSVTLPNGRPATMGL